MDMQKIRFLFFSMMLSALVVSLVTPHPAMAQEDIMMNEGDIMAGMESDIAPQIPIVNLPKVSASQVPPLFWNETELAIIDQVKKGVIQIAPMSEDAFEDLPQTAPQNMPNARYIAPRELTLSGLLYHSDDSWIIWLNGMRITPNKKPDELRNIRVEKEFVELKWYDAVTDKVYPVRLRPHQKFSIDLKTFLPG